MDIKLKNNNRNNGAGNNNVSANNDASSNSGASRNNGAGNSSKRIAIAIAGIIFITIITMCFFPVVYRTAERQKEQQKAEMMRESSDSVDNDTVQTLYQGSYVLYVEQMERSGQADAGGLFLNLPTDDEDYQYVKDTVTSTFDEWKSQFESDSWNIDYCVYKSSADCVKNTDQPLETCVDGTVTEKIKQYYTDIVCLSFDKEGALEVIPLYDENISGSVLIKAFQNVDREIFWDSRWADMWKRGSCRDRRTLKSSLDFRYQQATRFPWEIRMGIWRITGRRWCWCTVRQEEAFCFW